MPLASPQGQALASLQGHAPAEFCREQGAPAGSTFHYACLYQPAATRARLRPALALYNELSELIYRSSDPAAARATLAWWADEFARLHADAPRHPITRALQDIRREEDAAGGLSPRHSREYPQGRASGNPVQTAGDFAAAPHARHGTLSLDSRFRGNDGGDENDGRGGHDNGSGHDGLQSCLPATAWFLQPAAPEDRAVWLSRHRQRVRPIALHIARACRAADGEAVSGTERADPEHAAPEHTESLITTLTCASALEQLRHTPRLYANGRRPLPADLLRAHGLPADAPPRPADSAAVHALCRAILTRLLADLQAAARQLPACGAARLNFHRVLNAILLAQLRDYLAADKNILQQHIALSPLRKLWIAWRNKQ